MSAFLAGVATFGRALTPRAWIAIGVGVVVAAILVLVYLGGRDAGRSDADDRTERAQAQAQRRADRAADQSAGERTVDARAVEDLREDLTHAVAPIPDARPSDRRRALNCARLRREGHDLRTLPACSGLVGQP